jgi:hypothetical protein
MMQLAAALMRVEVVLRAGVRPAEADVDRVAASIQAASQAVQAAQKAQTAPMGAASEPAAAPIAVADLVARLRDSDAEAVETARASTQQLNRLLGESFAGFDAALDGFDFDAAAELLEGAAGAAPPEAP